MTRSKNSAHVIKLTSICINIWLVQQLELLNFRYLTLGCHVRYFCMHSQDKNASLSNFLALRNLSQQLNSFGLQHSITTLLFVVKAWSLLLIRNKYLQSQESQLVSHWYQSNLTTISTLVILSKIHAVQSELMDIGKKYLKLDHKPFSFLNRQTSCSLVQEH